MKRPPPANDVTRLTAVIELFVPSAPYYPRTTIVAEPEWCLAQASNLASIVRDGATITLTSSDDEFWQASWWGRSVGEPTAEYRARFDEPEVKKRPRKRRGK